MLICTVSSDVLIISLLKTCLHYPGDTRNVNAAFPVKCGPMGTTRVSLCSPWLVVWQWRCSTAERGTRSLSGRPKKLREPEESLQSPVILFGEIEATSILAFAFFGQFMCGPGSPFPQFLEFCPSVS